MATIDSSIAMGYKPVQIENPLNQMAAMSQVQNAQNQNALAQYQLSAAQRADESTNIKNQLYAKHYDATTGKINAPALYKDLALYNQGSLIPKVQAEQTEIEHKQNVNQEVITRTAGLNYTQEIKKYDRAISHIGALNTPQEALASINDSLVKGEIDKPKADALIKSLNNAPNFLDWKKKIVLSSMDAKDQIVTQETARANAERERIAAEQLGVSKGNLAVSQQDLSNKYDPVVQSNLARGRKEGEFIAATQSPFAPKVIAANQGKVDVGDLTTLMGGSYAKLNELKGITSTARSGKSNLGASAQSSMAGQLVGGALGTQEQSERDFIKSQRPLLVQAIVKATGITAGQINSNAELKNLLDAATDPNKGFESNARSLNEINRRFGTGKEVLPLIPNSPNIDALLEKYK